MSAPTWPPLALLIAWRYLRSRRSSGFVSLIAFASVAGLTIGVAALLVVTSVMNGFDAELKRRILGLVPHVLVLQRELEADTLTIPGLVGVAPFAEAAGMLANGARTQSVQVFGIDPLREPNVSIVAGHMVDGQLEALAGDGIVLGAPLASLLGVRGGDALTLVLPVRSAAGRVTPRFVERHVTGLFEVDAEVDYGVVFMPVDVLRAMDPGLRWGTRLALADPLQAPQVAAMLAGQLNDAVVEDWSRRFGELFSAVAMERTLMFLLLSVIIAIAAFNIVSNTVMVIDEKRGEIAMLRTMGLTAERVRAVFLLQGLMIGLIGVAAGAGLGLALALHIDAVMLAVETVIGGRLLAGTYFSELPVLIRSGDVIAIVCLALLLAVTAAWYAARRAESLDLVEALHG